MSIQLTLAYENNNSELRTDSAVILTAFWVYQVKKHLEHQQSKNTKKL